MSTGPQPIAGAGGFQATLDRAWHRPTTKDWADAIAPLPLFSRVGKRQLRQIAKLATFTEFSPGDMIIRAGERGDAFYLILSGRARVVGKPRARTLGTGDYFGEMALIDGKPRSATVTATSPLQAMMLPRRPFHKLLEQEPKIALALMEELAGRVRRLEKPSPP
jgi:CRP/FNR family cyclic AMP-dependent transcriptional regulator